MDTWNTPAEPPVRKTMPTWGKVAIGCGIASLLGLGACIAGGIYVVKKGTTAIAEVTRKPMQELAELVKEAGTPEGVARFYEGHPELAKRYGSVDAFSAAFKDVGTRIGPLPTDLSDFMTLLREKRLEMNARNESGAKGMILKYRNPGKEALVSEWENGRLVDLRIE